MNARNFASSIFVKLNELRNFKNGKIAIGVETVAHMFPAWINLNFKNAINHKKTPNED
jgi:hypothetical protein